MLDQFETAGDGRWTRPVVAIRARVPRSARSSPTTPSTRLPTRQGVGELDVLDLAHEMLAAIEMLRVFVAVDLGGLQEFAL